MTNVEVGVGASPCVCPFFYFLTNLDLLHNNPVVYTAILLPVFARNERAKSCVLSVYMVNVG